MARVHIFSNGFEFECWAEANCDRCVLWDNGCPLAEGIVDAFIHGSFASEIAARMGFRPELKAVLGWPCAERRETPPTEAEIAVREMRANGAAMLPGFSL